mgnify:CR=1 FL=1
MHRKPAIVVAIALLAAVVFVSGCSKLTPENYDQIAMGMTSDEVIAILGEADDCGGAVGVKNCTWGTAEKYIKINFVGEKVVLFSAKGL